MNGYHTTRFAWSYQSVRQPRRRPGGSFTTLLERASRREETTRTQAGATAPATLPAR